MTGGRQQGFQCRQQGLHRAVFEFVDLGYLLIVAGNIRGETGFGGRLFGDRLGQHLDDIAIVDGDKIMHIQYRQEYVIYFIRIIFLAGNNGYLALHPGIDNEISSGNLGNGVDQNRYIHGLEIQNVFFLAAIFNNLDMAVRISRRGMDHTGYQQPGNH